MRLLCFYRAGLALVLTLGISAPAGAQGVGFDPNAPCGTTLRAAGDSEKMLIGAWAYGFVAGAKGDARPVGRDAIAALLGQVYKACARDQQASLLAVMQGGGKGGGQGGDDGPGSRADAEKLLGRFLDTGADLARLTADLAPAAPDISAVYGEPLAGRLVAMYGQMFTPGARIGPKPDQNALIVFHATTGALKRREAVLGEFPGGYEKVLDYIVGDYPIVRFKFVRQGEDLGLAFDGLIFVNGRWVLMPKPWRALK